MNRDESALSMNEMAATLAHEVRNPLALAIANVDILELDCSDQSQKNRFNIIKRELSKIGDLMAELMELAVPAAIPAIEADSTELKSLLNQAVAPFITTYAGDILFTVCLEDEVNVKGAPNHLRLIINNLLKNAVEAIKAPDGPEYGYGRVEIKLTFINQKAIITVKDNGIGIDDETAEKALYQRYTNKLYGTGIGLYAAKALAEQYGGKLSLTGEPDKGCVANLELNII